MVGGLFQLQICGPCLDFRQQDVCVLYFWISSNYTTASMYSALLHWLTRSFNTVWLTDDSLIVFDVCGALWHKGMQCISLWMKTELFNRIVSLVVLWFVWNCLMIRKGNNISRLTPWLHKHVTRTELSQTDAAIYCLQATPAVHIWHRVESQWKNKSVSMFLGCFSGCQFVGPNNTV